MSDKLTPEGQPITMRYLVDCYIRAYMAKNLGMCEPVKISDATWERMRTKMRRDRTIAVLKAKCGVK